MAIQFPTSPNICLYTTWGKQNKRNMHWNEQQTSTNWRLDRIKIWSRWSELMKYIVYLLTIVLPAIKRVAGDTFVFQQDSAPVHRRPKQSNCWSAKPQTSSLRICGPPTALTSIWSRSIASSEGSCNSGSIRRRSRMRMNSRSDWLKSGLVWSRTLLTVWHCCQCMEKPSACLCSRKGPTYRTLTVAVEQYGTFG